MNLNYSSGKSSILTALFRGTEIASGQIKIGGKNIKNLNLNDLRRSMSIIPQDAFLFDGTLRENLDPTRTKSDQQLWAAVKKCRLEEKFSRNAAGLDFKLENNLSSGEKQLVCLARAILADRKILCIDEATAAVDFETDKFIQETIRKEFGNTTVLCIAHRIQTIFDYDKILAMHNGQLAEFDTAKNLLNNQDSIFFKLATARKN